MKCVRSALMGALVLWAATLTAPDARAKIPFVLVHTFRGAPEFGSSIVGAGDKVLVGDPESNAGAAGAGAAYLF